MASLTSALGGLIETLSENNKAAAIAAKVLAFGEIAINTAVAIAQGVKAASAVPFPGNLAAIATTVATTLTNMTSAIKLLKSAKVGGGDGGGTESAPIITTAGSTGPALQAASTLATDVPYLAQQAGAQALNAEATAEAIESGMEGVKIYASWTEGREVGKKVDFVEELGTV